MSAGFYKYESEILSYGPNFVYDANYTLRREEIEEYKSMDILPIDGWYWFDDIKDAYSFFNIPDQENTQEEVKDESI